MLNAIKIHLTSERRTALKILHKSSRDSRICDRIRCALLADEGWSAAMIATSQWIDETTARRHLSDWLIEPKLAPEKGGSQNHLNEEQTQKLRVHLASHLYPATQCIIERVNEWWGIRYTFPGMNRRRGLSPDGAGKGVGVHAEYRASVSAPSSLRDPH